MQAVRSNNIQTGERFSSRFFEFRYYKGAQTMHFYPKNAEVMEKMNRFVGKLRNWLPGDMDEANADFKKQYDKGEAFTDEYMLAYRSAARNTYGLDRPHYKLLQQLKDFDQNEGTPEIDRLDVAMTDVHQKHQLRCGPALGGTQSVQSVGMANKEGSDHGPEPAQMLLLAA